jgi:HAD superfamily hydrolase (TIGR01450 family)
VKNGWLASLDTFLFDVDGVLWRGGVGVPGVGATIAALEAAGKRCFFVTNNSTKTRDEYVSLLASVAGVTTTRGAVLSSAYAAAVWCRDAGVAKKVYCIGGAGLVAELAEVAGVECIGAEDAARTFSFGKAAPADLDPDVRAVVIGFDPW